MSSINRRTFCLTVGAFASAACVGWSQETASAGSGKPLEFSGIYPHLAQFNNEGECGTGAVVPWAGRLWTISYGPHLPYGSSDKLYEIDDNLNQTIRLESFGGTHANRMIHKESNQLIIGPYFIDADRNVRVVKSVDPSLDKEAVRVVKSMPKWIPGKQNGSAVRVKYTVPVTFKLQ